MKQHPHTVNRDLDDEVAEAIEHQYARKLMKSGIRADGETAGAAPRKPPEPDKDGSDNATFRDDVQRLRERNGS